MYIYKGPLQARIHFGSRNFGFHPSPSWWPIPKCFEGGAFWVAPLFPDSSLGTLVAVAVLSSLSATMSDDESPSKSARVGGSPGDPPNNGMLAEEVKPDTPLTCGLLLQALHASTDAENSHLDGRLSPIEAEVTTIRETQLSHSERLEALEASSPKSPAFDSLLARIDAVEKSPRMSSPAHSIAGSSDTLPLLASYLDHARMGQATAPASSPFLPGAPMASFVAMATPNIPFSFQPTFPNSSSEAFDRVIDASILCLRCFVLAADTALQKLAKAILADSNVLPDSGTLECSKLGWECITRFLGNYEEASRRAGIVHGISAFPRPNRQHAIVSLAGGNVPVYLKKDKPLKHIRTDIAVKKLLAILKEQHPAIRTDCPIRALGKISSSWCEFCHVDCISKDQTKLLWKTSGSQSPAALGLNSGAVEAAFVAAFGASWEGSCS